MSDIKKTELKDEELDEVAGGIGGKPAPTFLPTIPSPINVYETPVTVNDLTTPVTVNITDNHGTINNQGDNGEAKVNY